MQNRDEIQFKLLQLLKDEPQLTQRELSKRIGISLGMANYCLNALIDKGWIKARNFLESGRKDRYLYQLTPAGIASKARLTREFLALKRSEYRLIQAEIEQLEAALEREAK
jgi:EPS-associated MarR family transcriptional regulator